MGQNLNDGQIKELITNFESEDESSDACVCGSSSSDSEFDSNTFAYTFRHN